MELMAAANSHITKATMILSKVIEILNRKWFGFGKDHVIRSTDFVFDPQMTDLCWQDTMNLRLRSYKLAS